jgi:hypothetical protein
MAYILILIIERSWEKDAFIDPQSKKTCRQCQAWSENADDGGPQGLGRGGWADR